MKTVSSPPTWNSDRCTEPACPALSAELETRRSSGKDILSSFLSARLDYRGQGGGEISSARERATTLRMSSRIFRLRVTLIGPQHPRAPRVLTLPTLQVLLVLGEDRAEKEGRGRRTSGLA
jgi:hypothetical protein